MPRPTPPVLLYHITHLDNLAGIVAEGGLWAKTMQAARGITYASIAHEGIQDKRATRTVARGPGGVLHDYVPFYFAAPSPMLSAIHHGRVAGYTGGQRRVAHLVSSVEAVEASERPFVFTDGHAIKAFSRVFESPDDLHHVDWAIMRETYWGDTVADNDRKRRRQAEFLVHSFCPWACILGVAVYGEAEAEEARRAVAGADPPGRVAVRRGFYY